MVVSTSLMTGAMLLSDAVSLSDDVEGETFGDFFEDALGLFSFLEQL